MLQHHKHIRWKRRNRKQGTDELGIRPSTSVEGHELDQTKRPPTAKKRRRSPGNSLLVLAVLLATIAATDQFAEASFTTATKATPCRRNYTINRSGHIYNVQNEHFTLSYNHSYAEKHCQELNMSLPMTLNNKDFSWFSRDMLECGQTSTWFGLERVHLTASKYDYLWIDGQTHDIATMMPKPSEHRAMECGRIRLSTGEVSNMWCGTRDHGAICQFNGSCPAFSSPYNCYHNNTSTDSIFRTFHSALANWFVARAICRQHGGDLAVFKTKAELNSMIEFITNQTQKDLCDDYWVGLRRATWNYTSDLSHETDFYPMWHIDQPNGYKFENNRPEVHNCGAVVEQGDTHGWRAENCELKHHVTCQKIEKAKTENTTCVTGITCPTVPCISATNGGDNNEKDQGSPY